MLFKKLDQFLFPSLCLLCAQSDPLHQTCCTSCRECLPWMNHCCIQCALPLPITSKCAECIKKSEPFERMITLFRYEYPIDRYISLLKFKGDLNYAHLFSELLIDHLLPQLDALPDFIIPVPLHLKRLKTRGFNQATEIIKPIAKILNIPLLHFACERIRYTEPQSQLKKEQRKENLRDAFTVKQDFKEKHIAIFDDVVTTGETVTEIAKALKKARAQRIDVWCCARA